MKPALFKSLAIRLMVVAWREKSQYSPKGTGSTVAPYVLLELHYRGMAPIAVINTEIDQQSAPACSLEGIPYAYNFDADVLDGIHDGDIVELQRQGDEVRLRVISRVESGIF